MQGRQVAKDYYSYDLNPVPLRGKVPTRSDWGSEFPKDDFDKFDFTEIGICTGVISSGLEAIDFDIDGKPADEQKAIMQEFQRRAGSDLVAKLTIQQTQSGGFHIIYRCSQIEGNRVLARDADGNVLIETRGEGGFVKCYPSTGYKLIRNGFENIEIVTTAERNKLLAAAHRFDEESIVKHKKLKATGGEEYSKFPKYDNDPHNGISLLEKHGWTIVREDKEWVEFTRAGKDDGSMSGGYNLEKNFLYVFSSSTIFKERQPYNNVGIFAELECGGDYKRAYIRLDEMGYGLPREKKTKDRTANNIDYDFEVSLQSLSFLSSKSEEEDYLTQAAEGKIAQGLSTGWACLDEHFRLKTNSLTMGLGYDGVGKSVFMSSLMTASNVLHDWTWGAVMPENKTAMNRRRLMEAYSGQTLKWLYKHPKVFEKYKQLSYDNFHMVANRKHYSLKDVIAMGIRLHEYHGINALLVDPYNFFKVEGSNGYSWNNEILSELRVFVEKHCSVYIMAHPSSESPRKNKDNDGYLTPPKSYEIQGGADFPYRVDDFFAIHRIKNHPDKEIRNTMQFISYKIKEEETGGKVHSLGEYTGLEWGVKDGFAGYWDEKGNNPMYEWRKGQKWSRGSEEVDEDRGNELLTLL